LLVRREESRGKCFKLRRRKQRKLEKIADLVKSLVAVLLK
jgi:hypothetical protein